MIHTGWWPHRVKKSLHGTDHGYRYLVDTGLDHVGVHGLGIPTTVSGKSPREQHQDRLNEMRRWCRDFVGRDVIDFNCRAIVYPADVSKSRTVCFLFVEEKAAIAFMLRWMGAGTC